MFEDLGEKLGIGATLWGVLNKRIQKLNREDRKLINSSEGKIGQEKIERFFLTMCQEIGGRDRLKNFVVQRIVDLEGDRSYLEKIAIKVLGPQEVYPSIKELAKDQDKPWKTQNTQGGCLALIILGLVLTAIYLWMTM